MTNWNVLYDCLRAAAPELELRRDEPMNRHTSFKVGGPAALMALPCSEGEAKAVVKTANELGIQPFFLGNGSNLLVSDRGTDRFVVKLSGRLEWGDVREVNRELVNWGGGSLSRLAAAALAAVALDAAFQWVLLRKQEVRL